MVEINSSHRFNLEKFLSNIFIDINYIRFWEGQSIDNVNYECIFAVNYGDGFSYFEAGGFSFVYEQYSENQRPHLIGGTLTNIYLVFDPSGSDEWDEIGLRIEGMSASASDVYDAMCHIPADSMAFS